MLMVNVILIAVLILAFLFRNGLKATGKPLVFLGSGGHTGEMVEILKRLDPLNPYFVYTEGDKLSVERARQFGNSGIFEIPRARKVNQSFVSSIFTSIYSAFSATKLVIKLRPKLVLCNGPGSSLVLMLVCKLLGLRLRIIYIESLARVTSLSLTGLLVYYLGLSDRFLVQWPELANLYENTEYIGALV